MYSHDELVDIVSAANIAGHMENASKIGVYDDEELLNFITRQLALYAERDSENGVDTGNWYDWIEKALLNKYGYENL